MSRRIILSLIAGIGAAALPVLLQADATTQPSAAATTQPSADAPTTQPDANAAAPAPAPAGQPHLIVQKNGNGFTITTTGGMAAGPGQIVDTHITMTVTPGGPSNVTVQQSSNAAPPATQPADANAPATQP